MSTLDKVFRSALPTKLFTRGWGKPETLLRLIDNFNDLAKVVNLADHMGQQLPVNIDKRLEQKSTLVIEGSFPSPFSRVMPNIMDHDNEISRFQLVMPRVWNSKYKPMCIHFAGTGDQTYSRRRLLLANRLLDDGIGSIIVMNPYYWKRKPKDQKGSSLKYVSDLFVMGGALITECNILLKWCEMNGYGPLALHGISMGGYMASLCAAVWPKPISLIPCLSWTTASVVFVDGIMSMAVDWKTLTKQYFSDSVYCDHIRPMIQPSVPDRYRYVPPSPDAPVTAPSSHPLHDCAPDSSTHVNVPSSLAPTADSSTETPLSPKRHVLPESPVVDSHRDPSVGPSTQSTGAEHTAPTSVQSELARTLLFYDLAFLKRLQPTAIWSSWNLPDSLRRPFDSSLWHVGFSMLRSWPEGLVTGFSPPDPEVSQFLRDLLDFFTHLGNFPPLADPRLMLAVTAEQDAYVPRHGVVPLNQLYLGSEVRFLPQSGHVGAYLRNAVWTVDFRRAIVDCLNRQIELHHGETGPFGAPRTNSFVKLKR